MKAWLGSVNMNKISDHVEETLIGETSIVY